MSSAPLDSKNTVDCYCVCHTSVSSNAYCEHCKGDNEVGRAAPNTDNPLLDEILAKLSNGEREWIHDQLDGTSMVQENLEAVDKEVAEAKRQIQALILKELKKELDKAHMDVLRNIPLDDDVYFVQRIAELDRQIASITNKEEE